jgi:hypothetical protein
MKHHDQPPPNSQFLLYQDDNGTTNVNARFDGADVWLAQPQIALLFDTTRENIVQHISNILAENELEESRTCKEFLQVRMEGTRSVQRKIPHYTLDMIIAIGYRVKSQIAIRFRQITDIYASPHQAGGLTEHSRWLSEAWQATPPAPIIKNSAPRRGARHTRHTSQRHRSHPHQRKPADTLKTCILKPRSDDNMNNLLISQ